MLSRPQQIHLKRAQAEARISDDDYREAIGIVSGMPDCRSSTDARLTDRHMDKLLAYFEAIHWQAVDAGALQAACKPNAIFRQRGYWAGKNPAGNTSRDRFGSANLDSQIATLEKDLADLGYGSGYCQAIQNNLRSKGSFTASAYLGALTRTVEAKRRKAAQTAGNCPF